MKIRTLAVVGLFASLALALFSNATLLAGEAGAIARSGWYTSLATDEGSAISRNASQADSNSAPDAPTGDAFLNKVNSLCEQIKKLPLADTQNDVAQEVATLKKELLSLDRGINRMTSGRNASGWKTYLRLSEITQTIAGDKADLAVLEKSLNAFNSGADGLDSPVFQPVRQSLTRLITLRKDQDAKAEESQDNQAEAILVCDELPGAVAELVAGYTPAKAESVSLLLDDLRYFYGRSKEIDAIVATTSDYFGGPNVLVSASSAVLDQEQGKNISQLIGVNEIIRGAMVTGDGQLNGSVKLRFVPNEVKAEFGLTLTTEIKTKTVASRDGALVWSSNTGTVTATKSIYFVDDLEVSKAKAKGKIQSTVTGIDSGRGNLGQNVATQRVYEEKPYSQAESTRRMEQRVATQLESEVNAQVGKVNAELQKRFIKPLRDSDYLPRAIASRTTNERFYWQGIVGNDIQMGRPKHTVPDVVQGNSDLTLAVHESCPNNATWFAFAGRRVSDREMSALLVRTFSTASDAQTESEPVKETTEETNQTEKVASDSEPVSDTVSDEDELWLTFANDLPVVTQFQNDTISVLMHIDQFEKEERTYPELDVEIVYSIVREGEQFFLQREKLDVFPGNLTRGETIPARYQAIRTMIISRLEEGLKDRFEIKGIKTVKETAETDTSDAKNDRLIKKGTYVPTSVTARDGWFAIDFTLQL
ncbi:MAG: hypothetical protein Q4G68_09635 [Planctomycetia bacterium]|nr:hypothetical protein [Planctomycetia bacterium]